MKRRVNLYLEEAIIENIKTLMCLDNSKIRSSYISSLIKKELRIKFINKRKIILVKR